MTFVSFAQNLEDVTLWRALGHLENGYYIDVGAYSPHVDSVTHAFYDRGWRGINIEPNPEYLEQLKARRDRDVNLGTAVSEEAGEAVLHIIENTGLTTLQSDIAEMHARNGWKARQITVQTRSLNSIWAEHVPPDQEVHFLKVDVEGHERAVIASLDWTRYRPWIVVVEATVPARDELSCSVWDEILCEAGYEHVYWDGLNRFYLATEHSDLKDAFLNPLDVSDGFTTSDHTSAKSERPTAKQALVQKETAWTTLKRAIRVPRREATGLRSHDETMGPRGRESDYLSSRPLWERLLFRESGKPKRPLRRLLFHKNGKPRGMFRHLVLHQNGRPHSPFRKWMHSEHYQSLPKAVRLPGMDEVGSKSLSRLEAYFMLRLQSARGCKDKT